LSRKVRQPGFRGIRLSCGHSVGRLRTVFAPALVILLTSVLCGAPGASASLRVVASIAPLADFAREVGGKGVSVTLLLPPGASPHTYEPSPRTMQEISKAKVFVKIGAGLEFWADKLIAASNPSILTVDCSKGVDLIYGQGEGHTDPHIWLDPVIAMTIVRKIEQAFSTADPGNSSSYKKNAATFLERLSALDKEILKKVSSFRTKEYITFHPAWNYFSRRYGLKVAGVIEEGPGREPTPKHLGKILADLKRMKTKVIFAEPQFSTRMADAIAKEAGARVLLLDPIGGQDGRKTYTEMMRYNLTVMERAMR